MRRHWGAAALAAVLMGACASTSPATGASPAAAGQPAAAQPAAAQPATFEAPTVSLLDAPSGAGGGGAAFPRGLAGSWYAGSGYASAPYNPSTGAWGMPNGKGMVFVFRPDWTYTKAFQSFVTNGGCTTGFAAFEAGFIQANETQLRLTPKRGQLSYRATCAPSMSSDKPLADLKVEEMTWSLQANPDDPAQIDLVLASATATPTRFRALK